MLRLWRKISFFLLISTTTIFIWRSPYVINHIRRFLLFGRKVSYYYFAYCFLSQVCARRERFHLRGKKQRIFAESTFQIEVITGGLGISAMIRNKETRTLLKSHGKSSLKVVLFSWVKRRRDNSSVTSSGLRYHSDSFHAGIWKTSITVAVTASEGDSYQDHTCSSLGVFARLLPGDATHSL